MSLRGDHHHRAGVDVTGGEVGAVDEVGPPTEHARHLAQRVRHRRAADDDEMGSRQHRLDVDLERALALAGDGDHRHALGDVAELLGGSQQQQSGLAVDDRLLRFAEHDRLGTRPADPAVDRPDAVTIAREP